MTGFHLNKYCLGNEAERQKEEKSMKKRVISILLASVMAFSIAACGGSSDKKEATGTESGESSGTETESDANAATGKLDPAVISSFDGKFETPVTVKVGLSEQETYQGDETAQDNAWVDLYKEYGINLDVMYVLPGTETADKLQQLIMSGDYPDIFSVPLEEYNDYVEQGIIADVTDYYDEYLSDAAKEYLNYDGGDSVTKATVDDRIYGIPQMASSSDQVSVLWIRRDWLENLGLSEPKTAEEVAEVAKAFTQNDPDQNGKNDTFGFAMNGVDITDGGGGVAHVFNMFGAMPRSMRFIESGDEIIWAGQDEERMTYGLEVLSQMYKDGSVPSDWVTSDSNKLRADFASGKFGMMIAPMYWMMDYIADGLKYDNNADFVALPIPSSEVNPNAEVYYPSAAISFWCVSSKCENPEILFKMFNMSVDYIVNNAERTTEEYEMYCAGKEGQYTGKSLAVIPYLDNPADNYNNYLNESAALTSKNTEGLTPVQLTHYDQETFFLENKDKVNELSGDDWSLFGIGGSYYSVFGSEDGGYGALHKMIEADHWLKEAYLSLPSEEMTTAGANLASLTSETLVKIIMGQQNPESYSDFIKEWKSKGGDLILEEVNKWYAENK